MSESDATQLRRRNRELAILNSIAEALNRSLDLEQALDAALAQAAELLDLETGWIWLQHEKTDESYLAAAQNLPPALADNPRRMEGGCYCLDTYRAGDLDGAANVNVVACSRLKGLVNGTDGLRYHASIPLYAHGKQLGVLNLASADWRQLSSEDLRLLYIVGDLLSIAIERARLFAQSAQLGAVKERNRLAREIHDTLAQGLSATALHLETADALLESDVDLERVSTAVRQALELTRVNLDAARRSVMDLRAAPLVGKSLTEALALLAQQSSTEDLTVQFDAVGGQRSLPTSVEVGLYRIAQEALTNVGRHASAQHATLRLVTKSDEVRLAVEDNGRGFDSTKASHDQYGLVGMNERTKLLGGVLEVKSGPGEGTRVEVAVPVEPVT